MPKEDINKQGNEQEQDNKGKVPSSFFLENESNKGNNANRNNLENLATARDMNSGKNKNASSKILDGLNT